MDLLALPLEKSQTLDHSQDMLTQKTAENITSVLRELPASMVVQSEQSSKSETLMAQETAKTQKMFPDGKFFFSIFSIFTFLQNKSITLLLITR